MIQRGDGSSLIDESAPTVEHLGLSPSEFFPLAMVDELPFPAKLARDLHLPPPTITTSRNPFVKPSLLGRHADPRDLRRIRLVSSSPDGGSVLGVSLEPSGGLGLVIRGLLRSSVPVALNPSGAKFPQQARPLGSPSQPRTAIQGVRISLRLSGGSREGQPTSSCSLRLVGDRKPLRRSYARITRHLPVP